jgi:predicted transcriptional regulator
MFGSRHNPPFPLDTVVVAKVDPPPITDTPMANKVKAMYRDIRDKQALHGVTKTSPHVNWDASLEWISYCIMRYRGNLRVVKDALLDHQARIGNTGALDAAIKEMENPFHGDPEQLSSGLTDCSATPNDVFISRLSKLGMLYRAAEKPAKEMMVGEYLKHRRETSGLTAVTLGQKTKTPPGKIEMIENGQLKPSKSEVARLAEAIPFADFKVACELRGIAEEPKRRER